VSFLSNEEEMLIELRKIRESLEKAPPPPPPVPPKGLWMEFKDFLKSYKVLGLAVAFVIGLYLGGLVQALVKDFIMPLIGLVIPGLANLSTLKIGVPSTTFDASGNPPTGYAGQIFSVGDFLVALITFIIVAFIVFLIVKIAKKWKMD
jgi:large conductance mechanosensitive channel